MVKASRKEVPMNLFLASTSGKVAGKSILEQTDLSSAIDDLLGPEPSSATRGVKRPRPADTEADDSPVQQDSAAAKGPKHKEVRSLIQTKYWKK